VPGAFDDGVIAPVDAFTVKPALDEYVPPDVPTRVTDCAAV
jgi:hypothetical protein